MVRDACFDAGCRIAGNPRKRLVTELMFPLSSLELTSRVVAGVLRGAWILRVRFVSMKEDGLKSPLARASDSEPGLLTALMA